MSLYTHKLLNSIKIISKIRTNSYCSDSTLAKFEKWSGKSKAMPLGQPTLGTHPHIIQPGELVPGIQLSEFQSRRCRLMESITSFSIQFDKSLDNHLVIIPSSLKKYMSDKIPYTFRQNSDFLYLSGCMEPESCLVLSSDGCKQNSVLFLRPKDSQVEMWDGPRTGVEFAPDLFAVDNSLPITELRNYIGSYLKTNPKSLIWYDYTNCQQDAVDKAVRDCLSVTIHKRWESPIPFIHKLRLIKSPAERKLMKKSCEIAGKAILETIEKSQPDWTEHQIYANVDYNCRMNGAEYLAYPPVVAGGSRANIIHYINNNQVVRSGEMVLMDAGCEYHGYASDISRTWPINGTFTDEQRVLYEIILEIQKTLISSCVNSISLDTLFDSMCVLLGKRLQEIGLISNRVSSGDLAKLAYKFCPHHVSHYLGMDVHDTTTISRNINLMSGMVITMEPGIYISDRHDVPDQFRGLGIRVEDDILITADGPVILSTNCPREIEEIELHALKNNDE